MQSRGMVSHLSISSYVLVVLTANFFCCSPRGQSDLLPKEQAPNLSRLAHSATSTAESYYEYVSSSLVQPGVTGKEFTAFRISLGLTDKELHDLLGYSLGSKSSLFLLEKHFEDTVVSKEEARFARHVYEELPILVQREIEETWRENKDRFAVLPLIPREYRSESNRDKAAIFAGKDLRTLRTFYGWGARERRKTPDEIYDKTFAKLLGFPVSISAKGVQTVSGFTPIREMDPEDFLSARPSLVRNIGFAWYYMGIWLAELQTEPNEDFCMFRQRQKKVELLHEALHELRKDVDQGLATGFVAKHFFRLLDDFDLPLYPPFRLSPSSSWIDGRLSSTLSGGIKMAPNGARYFSPHSFKARVDRVRQALRYHRELYDTRYAAYKASTYLKNGILELIMHAYKKAFGFPPSLLPRDIELLSRQRGSLSAEMLSQGALESIEFWVHRGTTLQHLRHQVTIGIRKFSESEGVRRSSAHSREAFQEKAGIAHIKRKLRDILISHFSLPPPSHPESNAYLSSALLRGVIFENATIRLVATKGRPDVTETGKLLVLADNLEKGGFINQDADDFEDVCAAVPDLECRL